MLAQLVRGRSVRVLDFGIAKVMHGEDDAGTGHTRTGSVPAFSPAYAAPEQVTFSRTGPWTDVHALGLILTELLTARAPYGDEAAFVHEQVMAPTRPTPRAKGCDAGPFEAVIAKALALSPAERWKDAGELLDALERASGGAGSRWRSGSRCQWGQRCFTPGVSGARLPRVSGRPRLWRRSRRWRRWRRWRRRRRRQYRPRPRPRRRRHRRRRPQRRAPPTV